MTEASEEPVVRHQVVVPGTPERAFAAFTERFDAIKPREHNMLGSPIVSTTATPLPNTKFQQGASSGVWRSTA